MNLQESHGAIHAFFSSFTVVDLILAQEACGEQIDKTGSLLLSIPGEIRNQIWRYLLLTKYARELDPKQNLTISASILLTCRQIYRETSSILWGENYWIVVSEVWRGILPSHLHRRPGLPFRFLDNPDQLPHPALAVAISFDDTPLVPEFRRTYTFAYDRYFLVQTCIGFWKYASKHRAEAAVSLMPHFKETSAKMQDLLLQPFTMVRGVKRAIIKGAASLEAERFLKNLMETRLMTYQDVYKMLQAYKDRGDEALLNGDFRTALRIYYIGLRTATDAKSMAGDNRLGGQSMNSTFSLLTLTSNTFSNTAFAFFKIGDYKTAIGQFGTALGFAGITEESRALAHYRRGLAYAASNQDFLALMDFCYARDLKPEYPSVNEHIEAIESRLGFRLEDGILPFLTLEFAEVRMRPWRGDPRLVDGSEGWGRTGWSLCLMAMALLSQERSREPK